MKILDYSVARIFKTIGRRAARKSPEKRLILGKNLGDFFRILSKKRFRAALDNLLRAYPEKDANFIYSVAVESYRNLGITMTEFAALPYLSREQTEKQVQFDDNGLIADVLAEGKGAVFLSGHFGNWELMVYALGLLYDTSVQIIVKSQSNAYADRLMKANRELGGNKCIPMKNAARAIVAGIRKGGAVAMLVDQAVFRQKDALYPVFFGRPASTYPTPAYLALKFNIPLIAGFSVRQPDGSYKIEVSRVKTDDAEIERGGVELVTQRHVSLLEEYVRKYPEQWTWMHKRWKRVPKEISDKFNQKSVGKSTG